MDDDGETVFSDGTNDRLSTLSASPKRRANVSSSGGGDGGSPHSRRRQRDDNTEGVDALGEFVTVEVSDIRVKGLLTGTFFNKQKIYVVIQVSRYQLYKY